MMIGKNNFGYAVEKMLKESLQQAVFDSLMHQLVEDFKKQAERFGTRVRLEMITKVDFSGPVHKIWTEAGEELHADTIIISTGASARWLGLPSEQTFMNKGVSA